MEKSMQIKFESALQKYEQNFYADMPFEAHAPRYSTRNYMMTRRMIKDARVNGTSSTSAKRLAILLAAVISALVMISAARKPIADSLVRVYEKYIEFIIRGESEDAPEIIEKVFNTLGYLPKGYYRENVYETGFSVQTTWRNERNEKLILYQTLDSSVETMMGKEKDYQTLYLADVRIFFIEKSGRCFYFWNYRGYSFEFSGSSSIAEEEYMKMITNLLKGGELK